MAQTGYSRVGWYVAALLRSQAEKISTHHSYNTTQLLNNNLASSMNPSRKQLSSVT